MRKVLFLLAAALLAAPCVFAVDANASLDFYKKQADNFPTETSRESRAYAKALADGLATWTVQNSTQPAVADALLMQARLYLRAQETGSALVALFRLRKLFPQVDASVISPLFAEAEQALAKDNRAQAEKLFAAALPQDAKTATDREAEALYALSKLSGRAFYAPAAQAFENFFARHADLKDGDKVELWYGDLHRANGNYLAAIGQYKKAQTLYPNTPYKAAGLRLIGDIYADNLKDTASAVNAYTQVLREFPGSSETGIVYKHMAILDENNKQFDSALINYDKAIELLGNKGEAYEAYRGKADVYAKTKDYENAYKALHKTAAVFTADANKSIDSLTQAAQIAKKYLHDQAKYMQSLEKALLTHPRNAQAPRLMYDLGIAYEQAGKKAQAIDAYKKLIINFPTDKLASRAQGRLAKLQK